MPKPRGNVPSQSVPVCHRPSIAVTLLLSGHKHISVHLSPVWASLECKAEDREGWKEVRSWGNSVLLNAQLREGDILSLCSHLGTIRGKL